MLTKHDYAMACYSQGACNLSGLVRSLAEIMGRIEGDTEFKNRHPIVRVYLEQIAWLNCRDSLTFSTYSEASDFCEKAAKGERAECELGGQYYVFEGEPS